jgi:hypothetical protein
VTNGQAESSLMVQLFDPDASGSTLLGMRPATAIVVLVLLLVIAGAAIYQTVELLNPPTSVPSQLPD